MRYIKSFIIILCTSVLLWSGCKEMDSTYKEYLVPGGITYPGKAKNPMVYSGHNRVKIEWQRGTDPNVTYARVFWNNYSDSIEVLMPGDADLITSLIENLPENIYSFFIHTFDDKGNVSVPVETSGTVYGENYIEVLQNRHISKILMDDSAKIWIYWVEPDLTNITLGMEVKYTDKGNREHLKFFDVKENISILENYDATTTFLYRTLYIPDSLSIDTFYTSFEENTKEIMLANAAWEVINFSTQHPGDNNKAANFIDGNPGTRWQTHASGSVYPHFLVVDMGFDATFSGFEIFRRTDDNKAPDTFQFLVSIDNKTWIDLGIFDFNRFINGGQFYEISPNAKGRYFKFVGLTGPSNSMVIGNINIYGLVE